MVAVFIHWSVTKVVIKQSLLKPALAPMLNYRYQIVDTKTERERLSRMVSHSINSNIGGTINENVIKFVGKSIIRTVVTKNLIAAYKFTVKREQSKEEQAFSERVTE